MEQEMPAMKALILGIILASVASATVDESTDSPMEMMSDGRQTPVNLPQYGFSSTKYRNCEELLIEGRASVTGFYKIYPHDSLPDRPVYVKCDQTTDGGGWTVIQHRDNYRNQEDFLRTWVEYSIGFGEIHKDHWLGLENIHALTHQTLNEIRIDLEDFEGHMRYAKYKFFYVHNQQSLYKLKVNGYSGDAGDSLSRHDGMTFSTLDLDNDTISDSCAEIYKGAWWYKNCHESNLNGLYLNGSHQSFGDGVNWFYWRGYHYSLKATTMMIRPLHGRQRKGDGEL